MGFQINRQVCKKWSGSWYELKDESKQVRGLQMKFKLGYIQIKFLSIIIIFKKTQAMNVMAYFPNYYSNQMLQPRIVYPQQNLKVSPIITLISEALQKSIISYEKQVFSQNQRNNSEKKEQKAPMAAKLVEKQRQNSLEEVKQKNIKVFKSQTENNQLKQILTAQKSQKLAKESTQTASNDTELSQPQENKPAKKTRLISRRITKDKNKHKKGVLEANISELSVVQFAHTPVLGITVEELRNKREGLFERKVVGWIQKFKSTREKREIRMLNF